MAETELQVLAQIRELLIHAVLDTEAPPAVGDAKYIGKPRPTHAELFHIEEEEPLDI